VHGGVASHQFMVAGFQVIRHHQNLVIVGASEAVG
jgi:hypothetical protein